MAQAQDPAQGKHPLRTYQPSGAVGAMALPLGLLYGALAATICGSLYQLLVEALPVRWVSPLITMLLGYFVGFFTAVGLRQGKLRNTQVATGVLVLVGLCTVAVTFWTSYAHLLHALGAQGTAESAALADKLGFGRWLSLKVEVGWKLGSHPNKTPLHGPFAYLIWAFEALTIVGLSVGAGLFTLDRPFCERTGTWMVRRTLPQRADGSAGQILAAILTGDLATVVGCRDRGTDAITYTLHESPDGQGTAYLSIAHAAATRTSEGVERKTTELARLLALSDEERRQLVAAVTERAAAPQPAPAPAPTGAG